MMQPHSAGQSLSAGSARALHNHDARFEKTLWKMLYTYTIIDKMRAGVHCNEAMWPPEKIRDLIRFCSLSSEWKNAGMINNFLCFLCSRMLLHPPVGDGSFEFRRYY
jgi:hypothetical protein